MTKGDKEALQFHLKNRLDLVEQLQGTMEVAGGIFRQLKGLDARISKTFEEIIELPHELTAEGLRETFNRELEFQFREGDPPRDSFVASIAAPRDNFHALHEGIHDRLLAG